MYCDVTLCDVDVLKLLRLKHLQTVTFLHYVTFKFWDYYVLNSYV
jgi:hypothetical protein